MVRSILILDSVASLGGGARKPMARRIRSVPRSYLPLQRSKTSFSCRREGVCACQAAKTSEPTMSKQIRQVVFGSMRSPPLRERRLFRAIRDGGKIVDPLRRNTASDESDRSMNAGVWVGGSPTNEEYKKGVSGSTPKNAFKPSFSSNLQIDGDFPTRTYGCLQGAHWPVSEKSAFSLTDFAEF